MRRAPILANLSEGITVARTNYKFDKRQRDLAKQKKKKEEKLAKKQAKKAAEAAGTPPEDGLVPH